MSAKIEFIHQWQALGRVHPKLLKDEAFENCKKIGLTSLQSYVSWAEIEKRPGAIDFSVYDELVGFDWNAGRPLLATSSDKE